MNAQTRRIPVLHPFLFGAYAVVALLGNNIDQVGVSLAVRPFIVSVLGAGLLLLAGRALFRNWAKGGFFASAVLVLFFSYGQVYHLIEDRTLFGFLIGRHRYLVALWLLLFIGALALIRRVRTEGGTMTTFLNLVAAIALVFPLFSIGQTLLRQARAAPSGASESAAPIPAVGDTDQMPDVYYIILDMYARQDTLETLYGFDNQPFIDFLTDEGFYVAQDSHSNYAQTSLSLASSLNMDYVDAFIDPIDPDSTDLAPLGEAIKHSRVRSIFEGMGYTTIAFGSGFSRTEIDDADIYLALSPDALDAYNRFASINMFEGMLIQTTAGVLLTDAMHLLPEWFKPDLEFPFRAHRERILYAFEHVGDLPESAEPRFVFMHIVSPHPPFVFGPNGEEVPHTDAYTLREGVFQGDRAIYIQRYIDQLRYLNTRTMQAVEAILGDAERPAIIVVQSDHGSDASSIGDEPSPIPYPQERMSNFMAIRLPGCPSEGLYPSITPVNLFRVIFDACYGADFEWLPDRIYISSYLTPFDLSDVTNYLR